MDRIKVHYERELPGGGRVFVEENATAADAHAVRVAVERRTDPERRAGHEPPVIAADAGRYLTPLLRRLIAIADDDVEVAKGLLKRSGGRPQI
jgi:hypothetical protein